MSAQRKPGAAGPGLDGVLPAYFGHHKCGTRWISAILFDACERLAWRPFTTHYESFFEGDILAWRQEHPFELWLYTNADYTFVRPIRARGFHVIRDPRDIVVSAYFSHLYSHRDDDWPRLRHWRPYLRSLSKPEGLLREMEFNAIFLHQMLAWDYAGPFLELKLEDLSRDPSLWHEAFRSLGLLPGLLSEAEIDALVERNRFERLSGGRAPGEEDPHHHYRKGASGDWRNHFSAEHVAYFKRLYNPLLLATGYETCEDWG